jgi:hypothetical protein
MSTEERRSLEERVAYLEGRIREMRVPPVRDELLALRDVHGARLASIDARLAAIERDVSETESWIDRRFDAIDDDLDTVLTQIRYITTRMGQE